MAVEKKIVKVTKMFHYNPDYKEDSNVHKDEIAVNACWTAELENDKLVVHRYEDKKREKCVETYYVDGFHNQSGFDLKDKDGNNNWYSFNPNMNDFHIVPDKIAVGGDSESGYFKTCDNLFQKIKSYPRLTSLNGGNVSSDWVRCHKYRIITYLDYQYLISFNRLWCEVIDAENQVYRIHNNFGQVQFMRYRIKCDNGKELADRYQNINWGAGPEFKMMYPSSGESGDGRFDPKSGHLSYNAPFELKKIISNGQIDWKNEKTIEWVRDIAKAFAEFIDLERIMDEK